MRGVLSGCLRAGSFEQGLAEPPAGSGLATAGRERLGYRRAGSGLATAGLQHRSVDVMHQDRAAAQQ